MNKAVVFALVVSLPIVAGCSFAAKKPYSYAHVESVGYGKNSAVTSARTSDKTPRPSPTPLLPFKCAYPDKEWTYHPDGKGDCDGVAKTVIDSDRLIPYDEHLR